MSAFPVSSENEDLFVELCSKLKNNFDKTIWTPLFETNADNVSTVDDDDILEFSKSDDLEDESQLGIKDLQICDYDSKTDNSCEHSLSSFIDEISISKLRYSLKTIEGHGLSDLLFFNSLPPVLIPMLFEKMNIEELDSDAVAALLIGLAGLNPPLSISMTSAILKHSVYSRVVSGNISRKLCSALHSFTENHTEAVAKELFAPCLRENKLGVVQLNLFIGVINLLPDSLLGFCLRTTLEAVDPGENELSLLQHLVEKAVSDESIHYPLIMKLKVWSRTCNASVKFSKLVLSVISIYGDKVSNNLFCVLEDIGDNDKTLMKKAMKATLKKCRELRVTQS